MLVTKYCFLAGIGRQGLLHDLSKYHPVEFLPGCRYYQGMRSPNNAEREQTGVSKAWLHHKGRNRHHYEYWIDYTTDPERKGQLSGSYMPVRYVVEMFCDRLAACRIYQGDRCTDASAWEYYKNGPAKSYMHPSSAKLLEKLLKMHADYGPDVTFSYIRTTLFPGCTGKLDRKRHTV